MEEKDITVLCSSPPKDFDVVLYWSYENPSVPDKNAQSMSEHTICIAWHVTTCNKGEDTEHKMTCTNKRGISLPQRQHEGDSVQYLPEHSVPVLPNSVYSVVSKDRRTKFEVKKQESADQSSYVENKSNGKQDIGIGFYKGQRMKVTTIIPSLGVDQNQKIVIPSYLLVYICDDVGRIIKGQVKEDSIQKFLWSSSFDGLRDSTDLRISFEENGKAKIESH